MAGARLPSVRLPAIVAGPAGDEEEAVLVDLPPASRFGIAWPAEPTPPLPVPAELPPTVSLSSSEGETDTSEDEPHAHARRRLPTEESDGSEFVTPTNHMHSDRDPMEQVGPPTTAPRLSRAFSMPLPSQLEPFRNPRRVSLSSDASPIVGTSEEHVHLHELSLELADSVQMVIQTLLQLSPPQLLDPAKEQFSACSLSIPTPSVSAMFTSMKNLNYMSANMSTFTIDLTRSSTPGRSKADPGTNTYVDFDVGEMLQSVGDSLSGVAAQAGVDLVLFHDDLAMRHVAVKGDEGGLSYALSHVLRQIMSVAKRGDSIEIGLSIERDRGLNRSTWPGSASRYGSPTLDTDGPFRCSFRIAHRFGTQEALSASPSTESGESGEELPLPSPLPIRNQPSFKTLILRRLLQHIGAHLDPDVPPRGMLVGRCCALVTTLDRGAPSVVDPTVNLSPEEAAYLGLPADTHIAQEPTLEQLTRFAESLRGRKVTLIAHSKGSFAQHLTSYLTSWGLDVSHVSTEPDSDSVRDDSDKGTESDLTTPREDTAAAPPAEQTPNTIPSLSSYQSAAEPFILIDDDVVALRARLHKLRADQAYPLHLHSRKRPSLVSNHRPRSSPQVARVMGLAPQATQIASQVVLVHFTSLGNFKLVKDAIQSMINAGTTWTRLPEVIVVPKPAGPRRILTALHTAVTKPIVDPFFIPIATSPVSPSFHPMSPIFAGNGAQRSPGGRSTTSWRTGSDRSTKSPKDSAESASLAPSSPLGVSDNMEYFSDAASRLGTSPSSGLVIQSPDGQPAGIFFHPRPKGKSSPYSDRGQAHTGSEHPIGRSRGQSFRRASDSDDGRKGLSTISTDVSRRSPRTSYSQDSGPPESNYETVSQTTATKGKAIQSSVSEALSEDPEITPASPPESAQPSTTPRPPRRPNQDPRSSPPLSPQTRAAAGGNGTRRPPKRPTTESVNSAPAAIPKKGVRGGEGNIVPPISVLIVDDNPINQTILSTFMKKKKIKYDVAKNGEEAVQKWRSGGFHLILMDIQMPVMDGIQATKEIRRLEKSNGVGGFPTTPQLEGQQTPSEASTSDSRSASTPSYRSSVIIVALTASSLQSDRVAALAAGCNDFLTKPVSLHWLNNKIIEWGSIKALQMWADIRPEVVRSITTGQAAQARDVASKLHVPEGRSTPVAPRSRSSSQSRKPVSLDAAIAAAATLSKVEKPTVMTPPSDGTPESSSESIVKVDHPRSDGGPVRRCDTIPEVSSPEQVQGTPQPDGPTSVSSAPEPSLPAPSADVPAGSASSVPAQDGAGITATATVSEDSQPHVATAKDSEQEATLKPESKAHAATPPPVPDVGGRPPPPEPQ